RVWEREGSVVGAFGVPRPTHLAFASACELLVVSDRRRILRFDPAGAPLRALEVTLPEDATIYALAAAPDGAVWIALSDRDGRLTLRRRPCNGDWLDASLDDLRETFANTGLAEVGTDTFCLTRPSGERRAETCCFNWYGRPAASPAAPQLATIFAQQGQ